MSRILLLQTPRYLGPFSVKDRSVGLGFRADVEPRPDLFGREHRDGTDSTGD